MLKFFPFEFYNLVLIISNFSVFVSFYVVNLSLSVLQFFFQIRLFDIHWILLSLQILQLKITIAQFLIEMAQFLHVILHNSFDSCKVSELLVEWCVFIIHTIIKLLCWFILFWHLFILFVKILRNLNEAFYYFRVCILRSGFRRCVVRITIWSVSWNRMVTYIRSFTGTTDTKLLFNQIHSRKSSVLFWAINTESFRKDFRCLCVRTRKAFINFWFFFFLSIECFKHFRKLIIHNNLI